MPTASEQRLDGIGPADYGDHCAEFYDAIYPRCSAANLAALIELAGTGRVLELGIGSGRVAIPLAQAGVDIQGVESSPAMLAKLRSKPAGARIPVTLNDFSELEMDGPFRLIFATVSTFLLLRSTALQRRCMARVSELLEPGGHFLLEISVADPEHYAEMAATHAGAYHDAVAQRFSAEYALQLAQRACRYRVDIRYMSPVQLDAMAGDCGLVCRRRWSDWQRTPYAEGAGQYIAVYARPGPEAAV